MRSLTARKAMESITYLSSPKATEEAIQRLHYWRSNPSLGQSIEEGNVLARSQDEWAKFKGFLKIDQSLTKANVELMLLKRLNYVSLWTTAMAMGSGGNERKMVKDIKVPPFIHH
jgi:hypothetical protein